MKRSTVETLAFHTRAWLDGKTVQIRRNDGDTWHTLTSDEHDCAWQADWQYRIAPTPLLVPWTMDDVPAVCWIKGIRVDGHNCRLVVHVDTSGVFMGNNTNPCLFDMLLKDFLYSVNRKTWAPCGRTV
jgi:hypothetical protein